MNEFDYVIIGAGAAGIAAAGEISRLQPQATCAIVERDSHPGGILLQCIHTGFGLEYFNREMSGPEYAEMAFSQLDHHKIKLYFNTTVTQIFPDQRIECHDNHKKFELHCKNLILATGSREVPFGSLAIPSQRPAGIFAAGEAQLLINRHAIKPGAVAVILGAGDIGLIMARRLVFEGMKVAAVVEINREPGGVKRNVQTCIRDLGIELITSSTIVQIHGSNRVEGVDVAQVSSDFQPDFSTVRTIACDFVLSAIGLIPEISLARDLGIDNDGAHLRLSDTGRTSCPWVFACGNAARIYPIVDEVSRNAETVIRGINEQL